MSAASLRQTGGPPHPRNPGLLWPWVSFTALGRQPSGERSPPRPPDPSSSVWWSWVCLHNRRTGSLPAQGRCCGGPARGLAWLYSRPRGSLSVSRGSTPYPVLAWGQPLLRGLMEMATPWQGTKPQDPDQTSWVPDLCGFHCCVVLGRPWPLPRILFLLCKRGVQTSSYAPPSPGTSKSRTGSLFWPRNGPGAVSGLGSVLTHYLQR